MNRVYSETRCYSPVRDCEVSRISMMNDDPSNRFYHLYKQQEYFIEVTGEGKAYRESKEQALLDLQEAIDCGLKPGKITRKV